MTIKRIIPFLVISLLLVACASSLASPSAEATQKSSPAQTATPLSYPAPVEQKPIPTVIYPAPSTPESATPAVPPSGYEPQPGDDKLTRDKVSLEFENSGLELSNGSPLQVNLKLVGTLSDPCHQLRVVVTPDNASNKIDVVVYSVYDQNTVCIMVIEPFNVTIPLGTYASGHFTVYVNGTLVGDFDGQ
jgi:hypothetical protein